MLKSGAAKFLFGLVLLMFTSSVNAATVTYLGYTVEDPVWDLPLESGLSLSPVGAAVPYEAQTFQVSEQTGFDGTLLFYSSSPGSTNPLVNVEAARDDLVSIGISGFTSILAAGVSYYLVKPGHANYDAGLFTSSISGEEAITSADGSDILLSAAIPLLAAGLAGVAFLGRRRKPALATR